MRSESIGALVGALAKAQGAFEPIRKNRTVKVKLKSGGGYEFRYATLDSVIVATRRALAENGLALTATVGESLTVLLMHESGEWMASSVPLPSPKGDWQGYGSAMQYARRYLISTMLGVASEHDDDANAADGHAVEDMETVADPLDVIWDALETQGIVDLSAKREWCERALGRKLPTASAMTDADIPILLDTVQGRRALPAARNEPTKEALTALNKALDALAPWKAGDATGDELGKIKRAGKLDWINRMVKPERPFSSSGELTAEQVAALTADALAGVVP